MLYFVLVIVLMIGLYTWWENKKQEDIKKRGVRVCGIIVENDESSPDSRFRLGGNINTPTVKFYTESGAEIIGKPIVGFISQREVVVPSSVYLFYDKQNPNRFCLDMSLETEPFQKQ
jgi:hypothetical protein